MVDLKWVGKVHAQTVSRDKGIVLAVGLITFKQSHAYYSAEIRINGCSDGGR